MAEPIVLLVWALALPLMFWLGLVYWVRVCKTVWLTVDAGFEPQIAKQFGSIPFMESRIMPPDLEANERRELSFVPARLFVTFRCRRFGDRDAGYMSAEEYLHRVVLKRLDDVDVVPLGCGTY